MGIDRESSAAVAGGATSRLNTSIVPTAWKLPMTLVAMSTSSSACVSFGRMPRLSAFTGENDNAMRGR